jgi:tetratricopeptide (TPR) repeat protein
VIRPLTLSLSYVLKGLATALIVATLLPTAPLSAQDPPPGFVSSYLREAEGKRGEGKLDEARKATERALERDPNSLAALLLLAQIAEQQKDLDIAVHSLHRWLDVQEARTGKKGKKARKPILELLVPLDAEATAWKKLQDKYADGLVAIGKQYSRKKDLLGALEIYRHLLAIAPDHPAAKKAIHKIRTTGGKEVAVEDVFAGTDPTGGMPEEEMLKLDREHSDWDNAYQSESANYRYRTNAGFLVHETSRIAMEQMNMFYRRFFRFMEDGGNTPKIEIRIFKSRDEYLELGKSPAKWSAGHFIGSAVETYSGGVSGKESVRSMYGTLFHEAAHQFVSLTGPMVPGWLNEAYASFFEGCVILSNGSVKWNRAPPGRLMPLARRLDHGWMQSTSEADPGDDGQYGQPEGAPPFRMIVASQYSWGPPWYAPTWGVVYFLFNYRADDGQLVYREALHAYYTSHKRGRPKNPIAHFEEVVLANSPLSKAKAIDELDPIWKAWILRLRDRETGKIEVGDELQKWATAALARGDDDMALEFLTEARERSPKDQEVLWQLASLLEARKNKSHAAARYREFRRSLELQGKTDDPRFAEAQKKINKLDSLIARYRKLKQSTATAGLALAVDYENRQLPTMALEIARRMTASYSVPAAMEYYKALAMRTGKSLARWRVAYDERSLRGWSNPDNSYQAYGKMIRASVPRDGDTMITRELTADVTFDADFSLSAEMRIEDLPPSDEGQASGSDSKTSGFKGELVGLCFGRKGDQQYHAVLLHPKGFLDISSNNGGEWTVHDHRTIPVSSAWHELRIDVTQNNLDVYFDKLFVRSLEFPDAAVVQGAFGLLCGPGDAMYRNVRLLGRDPFDPAARIEREIAMQQVMTDASKRQPGTFSGFRPPELGSLEFVHGETTTLDALRSGPVMLMFWGPQQDKVIPCTSWLRHTLKRTSEKGLTMLLVCDPSTTKESLAAHLQDNPLDGAIIALDATGNTYRDFFLKPGFFGMPRILLLDKDGKVTFEGDPGLRKGEAWKPADGLTYVDAALDKLLAK